MAVTPASGLAVARLTEPRPARAHRQQEGKPMEGFCLVTGDPGFCRVTLLVENGRTLTDRSGQGGFYYEGWLVGPAGVVSLGAFNVGPDGRGSATRVVAASHLQPGRAERVRVTVEPFGGTAAGGIAVLEGQLIWLETAAANVAPPAAGTPAAKGRGPMAPAWQDDPVAVLAHPPADTAAAGVGDRSSDTAGAVLGDQPAGASAANAAAPRARPAAADGADQAEYTGAAVTVGQAERTGGAVAVGQAERIGAATAVDQAGRTGSAVAVDQVERTSAAVASQETEATTVSVAADQVSGVSPDRPSGPPVAGAGTSQPGPFWQDQAGPEAAGRAAEVAGRGDDDATGDRSHPAEAAGTSHPGGEQAGESAPGEDAAPSPPAPRYVNPLAVQVQLVQRHPMTPRASGTATLNLRRGHLTLSLRGLPSPTALGRDSKSGRPFNAYRVWLVNQKTQMRTPAGYCERVWGENFRFEADGLPLNRSDTILVTAEDRSVATSTGHPAPQVLIGTYDPRL